MVLVLVDAVVAQENPCIICPNGVTINKGDDHVPFADGKTCAQVIQDALTIESDTAECGWYDVYYSHKCCPSTEIVNPCNICPNSITAGDDHVSSSPDWGKTCKELSDWAPQYESGSNACLVFGEAVPECCPPSARAGLRHTHITKNPSTTPTAVETQGPTTDTPIDISAKPKGGHGDLAQRNVPDNIINDLWNAVSGGNIIVINHSDQLIKVVVDATYFWENDGEFFIHPGSSEKWGRLSQEVVRICAYSLWHDFHLSPGSVVILSSDFMLNILDDYNAFAWDATIDGPHI